LGPNSSQMAKKNKNLDPGTPGATVRLAEKQRHMSLLEKVTHNETLTRPEITELAELEGKEDREAGTRQSRAKVVVAAEQILRSQSEAARYAGVSDRTIRRWVQAGMMRTDKNYYIKSQLDVFKESEGHRPNEHNLRKLKAEATLKEGKVELIQMQIEKFRDILVNREEYLKHDVARIIAVKRGLLSLERKVAPKVPAKYRRTVATAIHAEVVNLINAFAEGREVP